MTEKQFCKNCKHLEHDGMFGIFCSIRGNNRNYDCPKFEKKVQKMTEKRYNTEFNEKSEMMQYVDNYREGEPNRWAIWNHGETVNLLNKQHETIMRLESEVFKLEQIIKTGKMPVENDEVLILIAKELYYLITHKGSSDLEKTVKFKQKLEDFE